MKQTLKDLNFDIGRMPLGKLTVAHLAKGYTVLSEISNHINNHLGDLELLSFTFYTLIPHAVGMQRLPVLDTQQKVQEKLEMMQCLSDMKIATVMKENVSVDRNPVDALYASLHCGLNNVTQDDYAMIADYCSQSHGKTHSVSLSIKGNTNP